MDHFAITLAIFMKFTFLTSTIQPEKVASMYGTIVHMGDPDRYIFISPHHCQIPFAAFVELLSFLLLHTSGGSILLRPDKCHKCCFMAARLNLSSIMNKLCSISCYQGFVKHEIDIPIMQQDPVTMNYLRVLYCLCLFMLVMY